MITPASQGAFERAFEFVGNSNRNGCFTYLFQELCLMTRS